MAVSSTTAVDRAAHLLTTAGACSYDGAPLSGQLATGSLAVDRLAKGSGGSGYRRTARAYAKIAKALGELDEMIPAETTIFSGGLALERLSSALMAVDSERTRYGQSDKHGCKHGCSFISICSHYTFHTL